MGFFPEPDIDFTDVWLWIFDLWVFSKSVNGINMSLTDSVNGQKYANGELVNKQKQHERGDHESEIL